MELLSKRKRKKANATYHECSLCKGLHPLTRNVHGYWLDRVQKACDYDEDMKMSSTRHTKYHHSEYSAYYLDVYEQLVNFERIMKSLSDSRYARDQRRRERKWW